QDLGLPFTYVRGSSKDHGRQNQTEGEVVSGQRAVVIEDLISTGKSSLNAVKALRDADRNVVRLGSIFTYGFAEAEANLKEAKCRTISLCNYATLLEVAARHNYILSSDIELLEAWRIDPANWSPDGA